MMITTFIFVDIILLSPVTQASTKCLRKMKVYPYVDRLSPVSDKLSPENIEDLSTNSHNTGDNGHTGDKSEYFIEEDNDKEDDSNTNKKCNCQVSTDPRIGHNHPFYFCIEHLKFQNIHLEAIIHHLLYSQDHKYSIK
jgi:hypothetical protein